MSSFAISGKVAIVTGAGSGMGYCFAGQLLEKGAKGVTLVDVCAENGSKALRDFQTKFGRDRVVFVQADTTKLQEFENAFKRTVDVFQHVDILINNAGILNDNKWEREVDINVKGTINGMLLGLEKYIPKHKSGPEGVIVNISSIGAVVLIGGIPVYTATKFAVSGLTLTWGLPAHYANTKVKVVGVCPGLTNTPLAGNLAEMATCEFNSKLLLEQAATVPLQSPEQVAVHVMDVIEKAPSGTLWVVEGGEPPCKYEIPDWSSVPKVSL